MAGARLPAYDQVAPPRDALASRAPLARVDGHVRARRRARGPAPHPGRRRGPPWPSHPVAAAHAARPPPPEHPLRRAPRRAAAAARHLGAPLPAAAGDGGARPLQGVR
eukprot:5921194-Prymnesium_polylepis.1